jgi:hypothetical protein
VFFSEFDSYTSSAFCVQLEKRRERREEAKAELAQAQASENQDDINKFNKRLVRVTKEQNEDVKKLLRLLGVPVIEVRRVCSCSGVCCSPSNKLLVGDAGAG